MNTWPEIKRYDEEAYPMMLQDPPNALLGLLLGILGIILCCIGAFGVAAFVVSSLDREKVLQGIYRPNALVRTAWVLGIVGVVLFLLWAMFLYFVFVFQIFYGPLPHQAG